MANLLTPILDNGIQSTNFFNGRLLMADDLRTEQTANRQQHQELGRAIGDGVVYGLVVQPATGTPAPPPTTVSVSAGLAVTRSGRAVLLPQDVQVALVASSGSSNIGLDSCGRNTLFAECTTGPTALAGNPGLYILTVMPTSGLSSDLAPLAELGSNGIGTSCASKYSVEGVQFRLVAVTLSGAAGSFRDQLATLARQNALTGGGLFKLRNGLSHACYGTDLLAGFAQTPFTASANFGLIDDLRAQKLISDCEVPLALIYWTIAGIRFMDAWSVRRRIVPRLLDDLWPLELDARRTGDAESAFLQFQDQISAMSTEPVLPQVSAGTYFYYLPAAGFLPTGANQFLTNSFFAGFKTNQLTTDSSEVRLLIRESLYMDPIDPANPPTVRLYTINGTSGYTVFMRKPNWKRVIQPAVGRGAITVEILVRGMNANSLGPTSIQVIANSETIKSKRIFASFDGSAHRADLKSNDFNYSYDLGNLPFDKYSVTVTAQGYNSSTPQVAVVGSERLTMRFLLSPRSSLGPKPGQSFGAAFVNPGWYGKMYMMESQYKGVWPPPEAAAVQWQDAGDPPADAAQWLLDWARQAGKSNPAARNTKSVRIMRDPAHTPAQTYETPYAYAVFDNSGGSVPLLLTGKDKTLDHPATVAKAAVPGVDPLQDTSALQTFGLNQADALGAAYKSIVVHALGVSGNTAAAIITGAQTQSAALAGTVSMFSGVDATTAAALGKLNIATSVDLANADPAKLVAANINIAAAERMVDEARKAVPKDAWSLTSSALGLSQAAQVSLQNQGITTLGAFVAADQNVVATTLGVAATDVTKVVTAGQAVKLAAVTLHKVAAPATSLFGIGSETAVQLAGAGFGTAGKLASADPNAVAKFLNGDVVKATAIIASAQKFIGA